MHKNPNGFFYRHCEPGEEQLAGGWTEEEVSAFVAVAEKHGAGDKWGLFSSHIPGRVGYQCSAVYRQVLPPPAPTGHCGERERERERERGLFSSHIPGRVGYQCSAVYRQVLPPPAPTGHCGERERERALLVAHPGPRGVSV
jgi:hypothetical protein